MQFISVTFEKTSAPNDEQMCHLYDFAQCYLWGTKFCIMNYFIHALDRKEINNISLLQEKWRGEEDEYKKISTAAVTQLCSTELWSAFWVTLFFFQICIWGYERGHRGCFHKQVFQEMECGKHRCLKSNPCTLSHLQWCIIKAKEIRHRSEEKKKGDYL